MDKLALEIAEAYYDLTELVYESLRPFKFGTIHDLKDEGRQSDRYPFR